MHIMRVLFMVLAVAASAAAIETGAQRRSFDASHPERRLNIAGGGGVATSTQYFGRGTAPLTIRHPSRPAAGHNRRLQQRPLSAPLPPYAVQMEPLVQYSQRDPLYHQDKVKTEHTVNDIPQVKKTSSTIDSHKLSLSEVTTSTEGKLKDAESAASIQLPRSPVFLTPDQPLYQESSGSYQQQYYLNHNEAPHYDHSQYYSREPEPIIEIIIQESNVTLPPPPAAPTHPTHRAKEPVQVFYVKYKKNPNGYGKDGDVIYEKPVPAVTPASNNHEEVHHTTPAPVEYATLPPPTRTTTLRTVIRPDSETFHGTGLHVTFGEPHNDNPESDGESVQYSAPQPAVVHPRTAQVSAAHAQPPAQQRQGLEQFAGFQTHHSSRHPEIFLQEQTQHPFQQFPPQPFQAPSFPRSHQPQHPFHHGRPDHFAPPPTAFAQQPPFPQQPPPFRELPTFETPPQFQPPPPPPPPRHHQFQRPQHHFQSQPPQPFQQPQQNSFNQRPNFQKPSHQPEQQRQPQFHQQQHSPPVTSQPLPDSHVRNNPPPFHSQQQHSHHQPQHQQQPSQQPQHHQQQHNQQQQPQQQHQQQQHQQPPHQQPPHQQQHHQQQPTQPPQQHHHQQTQQHPQSNQQQQQQHQQQQQQQHQQIHHENLGFLGGPKFNGEIIKSLEPVLEIHTGPSPAPLTHFDPSLIQNQQPSQIPHQQEQFQRQQHQQQQQSVQQQQFHQPQQFKQSQHPTFQVQQSQSGTHQVQQDINIINQQLQQHTLQHPLQFVQQPTVKPAATTPRPQHQPSTKSAFYPTTPAHYKTQTPSKSVSPSKPPKTFPKYSFSTQPVTPPTTSQPIVVEDIKPDETVDKEKEKAKEAKIASSLAAFPDEVPPELRQQLIDAGILGNADIQILDYDKVGDIPIENLPPHALENFYSAGGRQAAGSAPVPAVVRSRVDKPTTTTPKPVEMKVVRYDPSTAEGQEVADQYVRDDATHVDPVVLNDSRYNRYLPLKVVGTQFPLPDVAELRGRNVTSVVVLAPVDYDFLQRAQDDGRSSDLERLGRSAPVEVQGVRFVAGEILKELVKNPTRENYRRWLEQEQRTPADRQSIVLLVASPVAGEASSTKEIFMYDVATRKVSKLRGELSSAFVDVAEANAGSEDLDNISLPPSPGEELNQAASERFEQRVRYETSSSVDNGFVDTPSGVEDLAMAASELQQVDTPVNRVSISSGYSKMSEITASRVK